MTDSLIKVTYTPAVVEVSFEITEDGLLQISFYGEGFNWLVKRLGRIDMFEQGNGFSGYDNGTPVQKVRLIEVKSDITN